MDDKKFEPSILAFLCNWCSYAGADLAGTSRYQYPPNIKIIRVMCSGRVNPSFVLNALQQGIDGVIIGGCHPGECHYNQGNYLARGRIIILKTVLEFVGIDPRRVQMTWVSASEGGKFAEVMKKATEEIRTLGPIHQIKRSNEW
jgi:F420-non-reducing hydrogenase iron-sulfur subunit